MNSDIQSTLYYLYRYKYLYIIIYLCETAGSQMNEAYLYLLIMFVMNQFNYFDIE